jgi:hypothetical protein
MATKATSIPSSKLARPEHNPSRNHGGRVLCVSDMAASTRLHGPTRPTPRVFPIPKDSGHSRVFVLELAVVSPRGGGLDCSRSARKVDSRMIC